MTVALDAPTMSKRNYFTSQAKDALLLALSTGCIWSVAARRAGIPPERFRVWRREAEAELQALEGEEPETGTKAAFLIECEKVIGAYVERNLEKIREIGQGGIVLKKRTYTKKDGTVVEEEDRSAPEWQAFAWMIERPVPEYRLQQQNSMLQAGEVKLTLEIVKDWRGAQGEIIEGTVTDASDAPAQIERSPRQIAGDARRTVEGPTGFDWETFQGVDSGQTLAEDDVRDEGDGGGSLPRQDDDLDWAVLQPDQYGVG